MINKRGPLIEPGPSPDGWSGILAFNFVAVSNTVDTPNSVISNPNRCSYIWIHTNHLITLSVCQLYLKLIQNECIAYMCKCIFVCICMYHVSMQVCKYKLTRGPANPNASALVCYPRFTFLWMQMSIRIGYEFFVNNIG